MKSKFLFKLKNLTLALALFFISNQLIAQSSVGIFFQAVARDNYSNPAKYRKIYIQSSIIQSSAVGTKVLIEEHQANTDVTGMFSISIGNGTRVGGSATGLSGIDWSNGPFYLNLKVAITPLSGVNDWDYTKEWLDMGTTSFGAVPYAFYAANAAGVNQKLNITDTSKMLSVYAKAKALQNLETSVDTKLSISDTASMLIPYIRAALVLDSAYINAQLKSKVSLADSLIKYVTPNMLAANAFDTTTLSNRINSKASASDVANNFTLKLNIADTSLLLQKSDTSSLSNRINLKANSSDVNNNLALKANSSEVTSDLSLKANIASPTFTGTVSGVTKTMVGLGNVDNTSDANKPLSTSAQAALDLKANTSEVTSGLALKANIASPTFTGTVSGITKTMVGLGNTDNTSDANKPVSTATQTVLNFKEDITNKSTTTTLGTSDILYPTQKAVKTYVDATVSGATPDADANTMGKIKLAGDLGGTATLPTVPALASKANSSDVTASLALKANLASPTFTGTVSGITKTMVGLGNADNTSDANKPVSSAAQAAFDLKANTSDVNTALATKVDKVTGKELSTNDYTTAEKTKLAAITGTNTGDQDLSALATNSALALKANTSDVNTALNLKANSADVTSTLNLKANTTDVNTALATKLDKVTGKELSTNDYTTAEKTKLAAITGTNTGDQDLSALATNTALALKANTTDVNTALNLKLDVTGNASSATKLATTRNINGVAFDGSVDITVTANAGTLTGTTLATNVVNSSLSGVGTITSGTWSGTTIAVAKGGTGTNNGSITGTSALTFAAGGTNENISIKPTGTGSVIVGTGTLTPTSSAALDINSITQGFLPPRLTTTQRDLITTPVAGLTIWNITNTQLEVYDGSYWKNMVGLLVSPLNVGDTYGGGKVFYIFGPSDNGYIKGQTHGLIAATEDQTTDAGVKWFPDKFYGATGTYIGLGLPNTLAIITSAIVTGTTNMSSFAAGLANSYRGGENIDWFLPSKDELNLLYQAREKIGGFATNQTPGASPAYWSSTQKGGISFTNFTSFANGVTSARLQFFNTGGSPVQQAGTITDTGIDNPRRVRAIRIF
jgi:hypothetical protein